MHVKISRTNRNRAYSFQTIRGEKMARELSDGLEPSQLAQLVKAHHKEDCFCMIYLYTEQLTYTENILFYGWTLWALNSGKISVKHG